MFYILKKGDELLENLNPSVSVNAKSKEGQVRTQSDNDAEAIAKAKELGADSVVTSDGRKVL